MPFPGEALLIKLWETLTEKGIGGLLTPWQIRREGLAQLEVRSAEVVALAAAERDAEDIRAGRTRLVEVIPRYPLLSSKAQEMDQPNSSTPPIELHAPIEVALRTLIADAIHREVNVAKAVLIAEQRLEDDPQQPSGRNIEKDWLFRWRDYAAGVSTEELQTLWGNLLAGELKSPGSYSLRVLDFIRNLSVNEAQDITLLSRFVLNDVVARSQEAILRAEGITFDFLLRMQDLGVLSGVQSPGLNLTYESSDTERFVRAICSHGRVLVVTHENPKITLSLPVYKLTDVGRQVLRLGTFAPHEGYLQKVGEEIKQRGFTVLLGSYREVSENQIQTFDEETL